MTTEYSNYRSGDIVENTRSGRAYRLSYIKYDTGTARATRVAVDAAGKWTWFEGARPTTIRLALCRPWAAITTAIDVADDDDAPACDCCACQGVK